jgi:hypothetical protein
LTPSAYLALGRDIAVLVVLGVIVWLVYRGGEDHVRSADLKALQAQIEAQEKITQGWSKQNDEANTRLSADMAAIRAASSAPVQHNWVLDSSCKGSVLPSASSGPSSLNSTPGSIQPEPGSVSEGHRRDEVTAQFKAQWEIPLAQCRAALEKWPRP